VYDAPVRRLLVACAVLAGVHLAIAGPREDRRRAQQLCEAHDPACDWLAAMSTLERASVMRAIAARGYVIDPAPWGKPIAAVLVYNEEVFAEKAPLLQFFNNFHITTRDRAIEVESVVSRGDLWDQEKIDETARRLRDPLWTSVVAIVPVVAAEPGAVDVFIVTRDIWSLRLNTKYTLLSQNVPDPVDPMLTIRRTKLTSLFVTVSENNFLGYRDVLAYSFLMNQGNIETGPLFIDKNVAGQHLDLRASFRALYNRDALIDDHSFEREGSTSTITLARPLWRLAEQWGASLAFSHRNAIERQFQGFDLRPYCVSAGAEVDCQDNPDATHLPVTYSSRRWSVGASAVRQWGTSVKQQLTAGYNVSSFTAAPLAAFPGDATERDAFIRDVLPRSEVISGPFIQLAAFKPKFRTLRNINTYELAEDVRLGFDADATYSLGLGFLGSDNYFQRISAGAGYTLPWADDGFARLSGNMSIRLQRLAGTLQTIDNTADTTLRVVTPTYRFARIVSEATLATRWHDTQNAFFSIGFDHGLRAFQINEFFGDRLASWQTEVRTQPYPLWVLRFGGVAFYDVGGSADTFGAGFRLHSDIGLGLRTLIPQTDRELFRFDFAFPLDSTPFTRAGQFQFSAGVESSF